MLDGDACHGFRHRVVIRLYPVLRTAKVRVTKVSGGHQENQIALALLCEHLREVLRQCHDAERAVFLIRVAAVSVRVDDDVFVARLPASRTSTPSTGA